MPERNDNPAVPPDIRTEAGFEHFVRETQNGLLHFILRKGIPVPEAEDLAQEAYLTLWKRRADARNPRAFLLGIANTLVCAHHRWSIRLDLVDLEGESLEAVSPSGPDTAEPPAEPAIVELIRNGLGTLSQRQRQVLELVWLQNHPRPEAAAMLGISPNSLRVHEKRALDALRRMAPRPESLSRKAETISSPLMMPPG